MILIVSMKCLLSRAQLSIAPGLRQVFEGDLARGLLPLFFEALQQKRLRLDLAAQAPAFLFKLLDLFGARLGRQRVGAELRLQTLQTAALAPDLLVHSGRCAGLTTTVVSGSGSVPCSIKRSKPKCSRMYFRKFSRRPPRGHPHRYWEQI